MTSSRQKEGAPAAAEETIPGVTPSETQEYRRAQGQYSSGQYDASLRVLAALEKRSPRSVLLPQILNLRGLDYLAGKKPLQGTYWFKKALESGSSQPSFRPSVLYNLAASQVESGQLEEARLSLSEIQPDLLERDTQIKYHSLRARLFIKRELPYEAARENLALSRLIDPAQLSGSARAPLEKQLDESLKKISEADTLDKLYREFEDAPLVDLVLFRLGTRELQMGRPAAGEARLRELIRRFPETTHYADANELLKTFEMGAVVDAKAIGVLLPMNGKFAKYGAQSLQAIELAFKIFNAEEPDNQLSLVIEDAGEDGDSAVRGLNNLYFKHHVIAVIGPLMSKGIDQVTNRAQELRLPMVTLAQQIGIKNDYSFPAGLTPQLQAREIARHAIEKMKLKNFAIVHPRDRFGEQYSQAFWDAIESLGGQITGIESYTPGETDFRQVVDRLSGTYYSEARKREVDALTEDREKQKIRKKTRKTEKFFILPPIVDYEAVFIADEPKIVGQIIPTFAYRDVDKIKFLGTATWNSPELIVRADGKAEGAVFVDAFFSASANPEVKRFVEKYKATFAQEPGAIEALAYDAARILEQIISDKGASSREEVRVKLSGVYRFPGVTGRITYADGLLARTLAVLSIKNNQIVEVIASGQ